MVPGRVRKCNYFLFSLFLQSNNFLLIFYFPITWLPWEEKQSNTPNHLSFPSYSVCWALLYWARLISPNWSNPSAIPLLVDFSLLFLWEVMRRSRGITLAWLQIQWWIEAHIGKVVYSAMRVGLAVPLGIFSSEIDGLGLSRKSFVFSGRQVVGVHWGLRAFAINPPTSPFVKSVWDFSVNVRTFKERKKGCSMLAVPFGVKSRERRSQELFQLLGIFFIGDHIISFFLFFLAFWHRQDKWALYLSNECTGMTKQR